jgi:osmotically-inducible protein OsmY
MNQLMNLERVRKVETVRRIAAKRKNEQSIAELPEDEMAIAAMHRLRSSHNMELKRILCEVRTGILTIRGRVHSYYLKQLAQELVRPVAGVNRIVNQLEVVDVPDKSHKAETQQKLFVKQMETKYVVNFELGRVKENE